MLGPRKTMTKGGVRRLLFTALALWFALLPALGHMASGRAMASSLDGKPAAVAPAGDRAGHCAGGAEGDTARPVCGVCLACAMCVAICAAEAGDPLRTMSRPGLVAWSDAVLAQGPALPFEPPRA
ncbi:MAG: hypothetical protein EXQ87_01845 [Alphaproteobacteria bacterium]|nr:hypothetical protein [Alphaproteobacteria bacterium]